MRETLVKSEELEDSPLDRRPKDWEVSTIGELAFISSGSTPNRSVVAYWQDGTIPWVKTGEINYTVIKNTEEKITLKALNQTSVTLYPTGTVLVAMYGQGLTRGKVGILGIESTTNQACAAIIPKNENLIPSYLFYYLTCHYEDIRSISHGSNQSNLSEALIASFRIRLPPKEEQNRIAAILNIMDEAITRTESLITKLKLMKAGLLHDLLTRGLDENGELRDAIAHPEQFKPSPLGQIPKEWHTCVLGDVVDPNRPIVYGILMPGYGYPGGVPVVKVKDIINGEIQTSELLLTSPEIDNNYRRSRLEPGDLLFTIRGTVGRMAFVPEHLREANITQDTARIAITNATPRFVRQYLEMPKPQAFIELHTIGQAVKGINLRDVRCIPLVLPPASEQLQIIDICDNYDNRIRTEEAYRDKLKLQKKGLMHDLLTGRVRVKRGAT